MLVSAARVVPSRLQHIILQHRCNTNDCVITSGSSTCSMSGLFMKLFSHQFHICSYSVVHSVAVLICRCNCCAASGMSSHLINQCSSLGSGELNRVANRRWIGWDGMG